MPGQVPFSQKRSVFGYVVERLARWRSKPKRQRILPLPSYFVPISSQRRAAKRGLRASTPSCDPQTHPLLVQAPLEWARWLVGYNKQRRRLKSACLFMAPLVLGTIMTLLLERAMGVFIPHPVVVAVVVSVSGAIIRPI